MMSLLNASAKEIISDWTRVKQSWSIIRAIIISNGLNQRRSLCDCANYKSLERAGHRTGAFPESIQHVSKRKKRKISSIVRAYLKRIADKPTFVCDFAFLCRESRAEKLSRLCRKDWRYFFYHVPPIYTSPKYYIRPGYLCAFLQLHDCNSIEMCFRNYRFSLVKLRK